MATLLQHFEVLISAWTERKDIDGVLACMTDEVIWHPAVAVMPPVVGKAAVRSTLERLGGLVARSEWRIVRSAESGNVLFVEGVDANELTSGVRAEVPYAGVLEFEGDRICAWRDYLDGGLFRGAMNGEAPPDFVGELLSASASASAPASASASASAS